MRSTEPRFSRPAPRLRVERIAETLCFVLLLCTWVAAYAALCPNEALPHRAHAAQVRP